MLFCFLYDFVGQRAGAGFAHVRAEAFHDGAGLWHNSWDKRRRAGERHLPWEGCSRDCQPGDLKKAAPGQRRACTQLFPVVAGISFHDPCSPVRQIPIDPAHTRALSLVKKLRDASLCALKIALIYRQGLLGCDLDFMWPPSRRAEAWQEAPPEIHNQPQTKATGRESRDSR